MLLGEPPALPVAQAISFCVPSSFVLAAAVVVDRPGLEPTAEMLSDTAAAAAALVRARRTDLAVAAGTALSTSSRFEGAF
jgi:hypothetical protein